MQTEDTPSLGPDRVPAHGISNEKHVKIAVDLILNAFDATTRNDVAINDALRQADQLSDPTLSAGVQQVIEALARTRMLQPQVQSQDLHPPQ